MCASPSIRNRNGAGLAPQTVHNAISVVLTGHLLVTFVTRSCTRTALHVYLSCANFVFELLHLHAARFLLLSPLG